LRKVDQNLHIEDPEEDNMRITEDDYRACDWTKDSLVVEFKANANQDPFYSRDEIHQLVRQQTQEQKAQNTPIAFEKPEADHEATRGQLLIYATETFAHQPRLFLFQLLICGDIARFLFFDHSGVIVSGSFNYTTPEGSYLLARYIWTHNGMSRAERGWDKSVQPASKAEAEDFRRAMDEFLNNMEDPNHPQRLLPHAEDTINPRYPVSKIAIMDDGSGDSVKVNTSKLPQTVEVLVQRPFVRYFSAIGRATFGYIAYHIRNRELMFLKDTWRIIHSLLRPEREICGILKKKFIHAPDVVCGGDVDANGKSDTTQCHTWPRLQTLPMGYGALRQHQHHRLLEELLYPIESAVDSQEAVIAFRHCFIGE
jgi:hypothetical protein